MPAAIKRVERRRSKKKGRRRSPPSDNSTPGLPSEKKKVSTDVSDYTMLLYGREKIGKTTFFASFPDALFLTTEPGTKGMSIFEYNSKKGGCRNWEMIQSAVDALEKSDKFRTVIIDTVDRAYDMCLDYVCKDLGVDYPGEDAAGENDWGKSWRAVRQEFLGIVHRILNTGRGVCFTSHCTETEIRHRGGERYTRIFPSMSKQARSVVEALVNLFFYAEYAKDPNGDTVRVLITQGDDAIWAGHQKIPGIRQFPRFIPLTAEGGHEILSAAFRGEDVGLHPKTLRPPRGASTAIKTFFQMAQLKPEVTPTKKSKRLKKTKKKKKARR